MSTINNIVGFSIVSQIFLMLSNTIFTTSHICGHAILNNSHTRFKTFMTASKTGLSVDSQISFMLANTLLIVSRMSGIFACIQSYKARNTGSRYVLKISTAAVTTKLIALNTVLMTD